MPPSRSHYAPSPPRPDGPYRRQVRILPFLSSPGHVPPVASTPVQDPTAPPSMLVKAADLITLFLKQGQALITARSFLSGTSCRQASIQHPRPTPCNQGAQGPRRRQRLVRTPTHVLYVRQRCPKSHVACVQKYAPGRRSFCTRPPTPGNFLGVAAAFRWP
jgi:hypothetical protein